MRAHTEIIGSMSELIKNFFHLSLDQYAGSLPVHLLQSGRGGGGVGISQHGNTKSGKRKTLIDFTRFLMHLPQGPAVLDSAAL